MLSAGIQPRDFRAVLSPIDFSSAAAADSSEEAGGRSPTRDGPLGYYKTEATTTVNRWLYSGRLAAVRFDGVGQK